MMMGSIIGFLLLVSFLCCISAQNLSNGENINSATTLLHEQVTPISGNDTASRNPPENDANLTSSSRSTTSRSCALYKLFFSVVIIGSLCVSGVIGNILAVIVLFAYDRSSSNTSTPLLLGALSISDTFVLITVFMMKTVPSLCDFTAWCGSFMVDTFPYWLVYGWPCVDLAHAYSTSITVVVAVHRYIAVCRPHKAKTVCTRTHGFGHLALVVVFCTLFELPVFLDFKLDVTFDNTTNTTQLLRLYSTLGNDKIYQLVYKTTAYYIILYLIPCLVLITLTVLLVRALKKTKVLQVCIQQGGL